MSRYREMIEALLPTHGHKSEENDNEKEEGLHQFLDSLQQTFEQDNPIIRNQTMVSKVTILLRELALTHRWSEMIYAVSGIASNVEAAPNILQNLGYEGFLQESTTSLVLFKKLVEELKVLKEYDCHEVILEYFLFMITSCQEDYDDSLNVKIKPRSAPKPKDRKKKEYFENLYNGYAGFVHFIEWCKLRYIIEKNANEEYKVPDHTINVEQDQQQMLMHAERACKCFKLCEKQYGVWDIFVGKHVEMLEYHERIKDAEIVIEEYVQKDHDNPYSLKLLYEFYTRNNFDIKLRISTLEKLCDKIGFDSCVQILCTLYKQNGMCPVKSLPKLFMLLDYPHWKNDITTWEYFCQDITTAHESDIVKDMWEHRKDWWRMYHFTYDAENPKKVLYLKALAASFLISPDADYVEDVLKCGKLDRDQIEAIKNAHAIKE